MNKILNYITYQTFPADTANSLQTISNLKYFVKNSYDVYLYFPLREKQSSDDLKILQEANELTFLFIGIISLGIGITALSTFFATQKYLNLKSNSFY